MGATFKIIFAALGSAAAYLWGPWDALIIVLLAFVVTDYVTGVLGAATQGKLDSAVGFKGIMKKVMIFVLVAVGSLLDKIIPAANNAIRAAVCMFYIANEGLSILENAGVLGLPLPAVLKKWLAQLKKAGEDETTTE
ncbi:MAG TPA: phage holin family protein [Clostridia bacterium]|nr:phage holin family protein [Clostridia bacterium]